MNTQESILLKKRVDLLIRINKDDFSFLLNDREYRKKILSNISYQHSLMLNGRTHSFINTLIDTFFDNKKILNIKINLPLIKYYFSLNHLISLYKNFEINNFNVDALKNYIHNLPSYSNFNSCKLSTKENHAYAVHYLFDGFNFLLNFYNKSENLFRVESLNIIRKLDNF